MNSNLPAVAETFALMQHSPEEFREIVETNFAGETISAFDLERVRVPSGGGLAWEVPTLEGDIEYVKELRGIIIKHQLVRSYWATSFESRDSSTPPDCQSFDGIAGVGDPGGLCRTCLFNQFGSAQDGTAGKACREQYMVFFVRPNALMPTLLVAPVMSVKPIRKYLIQLVSHVLPTYGVVTSFKLEREKNAAGIEYARIFPSVVQRLSQEEMSHMREIVKMYAPLLEQAARVIPEEDTV